MTLVRAKITIGWLAVGGLILALVGQVQAQQLDLRSQADLLAGQVQTLTSKQFQRVFLTKLATHSAADRSQLIKQLLLNLRHQEPSETGYWLVDHVSHMAAPLTVPHPEGADVLHDPIGLAAMAQGTANTWSWQHWHNNVLSQGASGQWQLLDELAALAGSSKAQDKAVLLGAAAAVKQLAPEDLTHPQLTKRLVDHPALKPLTLGAVRRTDNIALLQDAMQTWTETDQRSVILTLDRCVNEDLAVTTWQRLIVTQSDNGPAARDGLSRLLRSGRLSAEQTRQVRSTLEMDR